MTKQTILTLMLAGCAVDGPDLDETDQDIVGGTSTLLRMEIGKMHGYEGYCTATLIAPQYIITAAHCTGYLDMRITDPDWDFVLIASNLSDTGQHFAIDRVYSFSRPFDYPNPGWEYALSPNNGGVGAMTADIAIAHLATPVPATLATPATLSSVRPVNGTWQTTFGMGCDDRTTKNNGARKRYRSFLYPDATDSLCPGDSGGPAVVGLADQGGAIWGLNTGYLTDSGDDVYADVAIVKPEIEALMREWEGTTYLQGFDRGGLDYRDFDAAVETPLACLSACVSDSVCRTWAYTEPGTRTAAAHCWLKKGYADASVDAAVTSGAIELAEVGVDRRGGDYRSFAPPQARAELCAAACANESNCVGYTYVAPTTSAPTPMCWLKNQIMPVATNSITTSGLRRGFEVNVDRIGSDLRDFTAATAWACEQSCRTDERCRAFTFTSTNRCYLKNGVGNPQISTGKTSGLKRGLEVDSDRASGTLIRTFTMGYRSPELCQSSCAADTACVAWTYVPGSPTASNSCRLMSTIGPRVLQVGHVSGVKGLEFF